MFFSRLWLSSSSIFVSFIHWKLCQSVECLFSELGWGRWMQQFHSPKRRLTVPLHGRRSAASRQEPSWAGLGRVLRSERGGLGAPGGLCCPLRAVNGFKPPMQRLETPLPAAAAVVVVESRRSSASCAACARPCVPGKTCSVPSEEEGDNGPVSWTSSRKETPIQV